MKVIAFTGAAGSGKDTAANILISRYGYKKMSFAGTLKDAIAIIFGWPRDMIEGATKESREWREMKDEWWSERLGINITPRRVLQLWGTEVGRNAFHKDIWIASLERQLYLAGADDAKIVITDCRFENEAELIKQYGGKLINIVRPGVELSGSHITETGLPEHLFDDTVYNDGDLLDLEIAIMVTLKDHDYITY